MTYQSFNKLYVGSVYHKRYYPVVHDFTYPIFYITLSFNNFKKIKSPLIKFNKIGLFSFYLKDHGKRDGSDLNLFARDLLSKNNLPTDYKDIVIQTLPRILGFVFNPVSFWYIYDHTDEVYAIIAEVNNTFGETHSYVLTPNELNGKKLMQVSPFNQIQGHYDFIFSNQASSNSVTIKYFAEKDLTLLATINGQEQELNTKNLLINFFKYPLLTFMAVYRIHLQALYLYLKKVPFYGKDGVVHDK